MKVANMPEYARRRKYVVFRTVDGVNWFYGGYDKYGVALDIAMRIGGQVVPSEEVEV